MNYLDILPNDVMKIINRKVQDLHIIERRIKRKENRKRNRELEEIADRKRDISKKYIVLYFSSRILFKFLVSTQTK